MYPPERRPAGYIEWLRRQEPEIIWGEDKNGKKHAPPLKTEADWIKAGEIVFDAVLGSFPLADRDLEGVGEYAAQRGIPLAQDGVLPFFEFRIVEKGKIEIGSGSCGSCHTRADAGRDPVKGRAR